MMNITNRLLKLTTNERADEQTETGMCDNKKQKKQTQSFNRRCGNEVRF